MIQFNMLTCLPSYLVYLTLFSIFTSIINASFSQSYGHIYDPVNCSTDSPNCTLYINQTVTFVCKCVKANCVTTWILNGNSKSKNGVKYTVNVTEDLKGVIECYTDDPPPNTYNWTITVLQPIPPKFLETPQGTPQGHSFHAETINIGGANGAIPSCSICVNCTVSGAPTPTMTWQYRDVSMSEYDYVITNQSNLSSPYYLQDNGQKLCFDDIKRYDLVDGTSYQCNAANVAGSKSGSFNALVNAQNLPQPGPSATKHPLYLGGNNATLIMDTVYPGLSAYFNVCRYNRSFPNILISCCSCYGDCEFGELSGHTESNYASCQLNTSYSGIYQFKIYTVYIYPCFLNIGDPIEVNDINNSSSSSHEFILILICSLVGLLVLIIILLVGTGYCGHKHYTRAHHHVVIHNNNDNQVNTEVSASEPLLQTASHDDYGSVDNTLPESRSKTNNELTLTSAGASLQPASVDKSNKSDEQLPLQATDDDKAVPIPSTCKALAYYNYCRKTVYIAHGNDSEQWVVETLIPFLIELNVKVIRISDAIPGKAHYSARIEFIDEANKTILVISEQTKNDKKFVYDINRALHKDSDPTKITIIPILYENVAHSDIPKQVVHLISIRNNDPDFVTKITKSIYS